MKHPLLSATTGLACAVFTGLASAAPVEANSFIHLNYLEEGVPYNGYVSQTLTTATSVAETLPSAAGQVLQLRGDLATGEVGARVASNSAGSSAQAIVSMFDTLMFSSAVNVEFSIRLDGSFAMNGDRFAVAYSEYRVFVYDITGRDTWTSSFDVFPGFTLVNADSSLTQVAQAQISVQQGQSSPAGTFAIDVTKAGSFVADPGKTYGIQLIGNAYADHGTSADFLNTGAFSFTNLNGASFTSGSGLFLNQATAVPEPAAAWLLALGVAGLPLTRRLRRG